MKTLLIVRHAKSSWDHSDLDDSQRPLNDRGKRDAPAMAQRLIRNGIAIDRFVSSPARRALQTAQSFLHAFGGNANEIRVLPELYLASAAIFRQVVTGLDNDDHTVALFSHNPGITDFVNTLTEAKVDNMPTCSVFAVRCPVESWSEFLSSRPQFWFFDFPKAHRHD